MKGQIQKPEGRDGRRTSWGRTGYTSVKPILHLPAVPPSLREVWGSSFSPGCTTVKRVFLQHVGKLIRANLFSSLWTRMPGRTCWRSVPQREMFLIIFTHLIWEVHGNSIIAVITRSLPCGILQQLWDKLSEALLAFLFITRSPQTMFHAIQSIFEMSCYR